MCWEVERKSVEWMCWISGNNIAKTHNTKEHMKAHLQVKLHMGNGYKVWNGRPCCTGEGRRGREVLLVYRATTQE